MLIDRQYTRRMLEFISPALAVHHASLPQIVNELSDGDRTAGWAAMNKLPYADAVQHAGGPIACIDCGLEGRCNCGSPAQRSSTASNMAGQGVAEGLHVNTDATRSRHALRLRAMPRRVLLP